MDGGAIDRLNYNPSGAFYPKQGLEPAALEELSARLKWAQEQVWNDLRDWHAKVPVPAEKDPLDAGFIDLPERLLAEFEARRGESELGKILETARMLSREADRTVVLGIGGSYMGAKALFEACCHPYHNELSRQERGGIPRIYFEGNNLDNDALQGLLDLLNKPTDASGPHGNWNLIVISKSGGTLETAVAFRVLLQALKDSCGGDAAQRARRIVPVTGTHGRLAELSKALGCRSIFPIPDGVGGRFSIFCAVGLLPAAVLGLDVVRLLRGACDMNRQFRELPLGKNPVLDYVGVSHLLELNRGLNLRVLSTWGKGLESLGFWYDQLLSESLGKNEQGATPITVVNTRDLHSRGQQHQQGKRDKLITNVVVSQPRRDRIVVGKSDLDQDQLNLLAGKSYPELLSAAIEGTQRAYAGDHRPTATITLPRLDEYSMGQLFQMLMLTTVVEGRLIGINPYGQPGVEAYKTHMNAILRGA